MPKKKRRFGFIFALLAKMTKLVKVFKLFKFTKIFLTMFSMGLSVVVYSAFRGPWFAIGLVGMLFIHEMGHIVALRIKGFTTPGPVFIPMLGAVIFAPKMDNPEDEAFIGYAGPFVGGIAALGAFLIWLLSGQPANMLLFVAYIGAYINLFNMIPIRPMDGGRVTQIIGGWVGYVGLLGLLVFSLFIKQPMILLIWILVLDDIKKIHPRLKFAIGVTCELAMITLMLLGFSEQWFWVDCIDIGLATVFNLNYYAQAFTGPVSTESVVARYVPSSIRAKWALLYFALLASLVALMVVQLPYLSMFLARK